MSMDRPSIYKEMSFSGHQRNEKNQMVGGKLPKKFPPKLVRNVLYFFAWHVILYIVVNKTTLTTELL